MISSVCIGPDIASSQLAEFLGECAGSSLQIVGRLLDFGHVGGRVAGSFQLNLSSEFQELVGVGHHDLGFPCGGMMTFICCLMSGVPHTTHVCFDVGVIVHALWHPLHQLTSLVTGLLIMFEVYNMSDEVKSERFSLQFKTSDYDVGMTKHRSSPIASTQAQTAIRKLCTRIVGFSPTYSERRIGARRFKWHSYCDDKFSVRKVNDMYQKFCDLLIAAAPVERGQEGCRSQEMPNVWASTLK